MSWNPINGLSNTTNRRVRRRHIGFAIAAGFGLGLLGASAAPPIADRVEGTFAVLADARLTPIGSRAAFDDQWRRARLAVRSDNFIRQSR